MSTHALQTYKQVQVSTASAGELILMLFDGAIRFANQALSCMEQSDLAGANDKLLKAQDIVYELIVALNLEVGEIARNLYRLYMFINQLLIQANVSKDPKLVQQAVGMLTELRTMWHEVVERV
ncbi:MAG TPA: flagellar export chaperone FliS [Firmicutes bacterium]|nr:flagellar export chaperone FliS [Bacillota bacterium]